MAKKGDNNRSQYDAADFEDIVTTLPIFNKKEIFKHLNKFGCSEESLETVMCRFKVSKTTATEYINELVRRSEKYSHQECASFCYDNIEAWLLVLKQNDCARPLESFAEYLAEIRRVEDFPEPVEVKGINLRSAYRFLEYGMLGLPQPAMNIETVKFLAKEMAALIEEVNDDDGDDVAFEMMDKFEENQSENSNTSFHTSNVDPFGLG